MIKLSLGNRVTWTVASQPSSTSCPSVLQAGPPQRVGLLPLLQVLPLPEFLYPSLIPIKDLQGNLLQELLWVRGGGMYIPQPSR